MDLDLPPMHLDLAFNAPLSPSRAGELAAFVTGSREGAHVVDVGCGWAELLLQAVAADPSARGTGVDVDPVAIAHGRATARERGLEPRVTLVVGNGAVDAPARADALVCIGARQVWGDHDDALAALRAMVPAGSRVVYGDGIWSRPPSPAAAAALGAEPDEYGPLVDLVDTAVRHGFRPLSVAEASQEEWDAFESGYGAGYERWLLDNPPSHPHTGTVLQLADDHRRAYLGGYRGVLGFAYFGLVAR